MRDLGDPVSGSQPVTGAELGGQVTEPFSWRRRVFRCQQPGYAEPIKVPVGVFQGDKNVDNYAP